MAKKAVRVLWDRKNLAEKRGHGYIEFSIYLGVGQLFSSSPYVLQTSCWPSMGTISLPYSSMECDTGVFCEGMQMRLTVMFEISSKETFTNLLYPMRLACILKVKSHPCVIEFISCGFGVNVFCEDTCLFFWLKRQDGAINRRGSSFF